MNWTEEHDILLCREIIVEESFKLKFGSRERGKCWDKIAENLNAVEATSFCVDQRSVRERYVKLERAFKVKKSKELRASGISPEWSELDAAIEEIVERKESEEENKKKIKNQDRRFKNKKRLQNKSENEPWRACLKSRPGKGKEGGNVQSQTSI